MLKYPSLWNYYCTTAVFSLWQSLCASRGKSPEDLRPHPLHLSHSQEDREHSGRKTPQPRLQRFLSACLTRKSHIASTICRAEVVARGQE